MVTTRLLLVSEQRTKVAVCTVAVVLQLVYWLAMSNVARVLPRTVFAAF